MSHHSFLLTLHDTAILKGIAICAMLVHHLFYENPEYGAVVWHCALLGKVCVAIFLFLSGFGLTFQFGKMPIHGLNANSGGQIIRFLLRRYVKFYLNYWVIFLIFVPIGVFLFDRPLSVPYGENVNIPFALVKDILGLQKYHSYNMTWWFNQIIIVLWLTFPILYQLVKNRYSAWLLLPVAIVLFPVNALAFVLGMYVAYYREGIGRVFQKLNIFFVLVTLLVLLSLLCLSRESGYIGCLSSIKADPYIALLISVIVAVLTKFIAFQFPVMAYLGKHSMNMYMVHTFFFGYFFHSFIYGFKYPIFIFLALLISSLALSIILEYVKRRLGFYNLINHISSKLST